MLASTTTPLEVHNKRMAPVWIPATLSVGLLIAAVYLGGRILTGHSRPATATVAQTPPLTRVRANSQPEAETPKPVMTPEGTDEQVHMITPQSGERYLQVGALDLEATRRYIQQLRRAELEPHVAPGPKPELRRILLGPFADLDSLTRARGLLDQAGIENFVRKY
jgi:cell division septation protein DedD